MTEFEDKLKKRIKEHDVAMTGLHNQGFVNGLKVALDLFETTDKLSVEKLQEELESCIQTLIEASAAATITQDIVVGNLVDRKLADLAKTHKLAVDYIEKVTGKNIDVVLAENAALEAERR